MHIPHGTLASAESGFLLGRGDLRGELGVKFRWKGTNKTIIHKIHICGLFAHYWYYMSHQYPIIIVLTTAHLTFID